MKTDCDMQRWKSLTVCIRYDDIEWIRRMNKEYQNIEEKKKKVEKKIQEKK